MDYLIEKLNVSVYQVPTDGPESDGTLEWDSTTLVLVEAVCGKTTGLGYTYGHKSAAEIILGKLKPLVCGQDALDIRRHHDAMGREVRNLGRPGLAAGAISAVDIALWDLKARLLELPLVKLLGQAQSAVTPYGSGGFTSYTEERLQQQLGGWAEAGLGCVKMKIGREPAKDLARVAAARRAIGPKTELFVDANGAYAVKQALEHAERFQAAGVRWLEEPVSSDDLAGLRLLRQRAPASMVIAAGEYGYDTRYFRHMLECEAVDVLQADATRCGGITGFMQAGALCEAFGRPFSAHTAPSIHLHPSCALGCTLNIEYFYDHYRIEEMFFEGAAKPVNGQLRPDLSRPGLGLEFKRADAGKYQLGT